MGLATKIKEALHGDKEPQRSPTDTSKTPGSFPSSDVSRSHNRNDTADNNAVGNSSRLSDEKLPGSKAAEYPHGSSTGPLGTSGATGRHSRDVSGSHQDSGLAHKIVPGTTAASSGSPHTKKNSDPYWGESERTSGHLPGHGGAAHDRTGEALHAHEVNDRYNSTNPSDDFSRAGTAGHTSGRNTNLPGQTGAYGSGASEGSHGPHASRVANAADPRVDSDRDHRGAPGTSNYASGQHTTGSGHPGSAGYGSAGTSEGNHGPHSSRVANAADPRVDSDRDHRGAPNSTGYGSESSNNRFNAPGGTHTAGTTGAASNLTHRPLGGNNGRRDEKINEYDAPTNSSDRSHGGVGAGVVGGAAAGYGASKLADRHHQDDLRDQDPSYSGSRGHNTHDNVGSRERLSSAGTGLDDPHAFNTATQPGTGVGTSMLDPHGPNSGHHGGNRSGIETGSGIGSESHLQGSQGSYAERDGHGVPSTHGAGLGHGHNTSSGLPGLSNTDSHSQGHNSSGLTGLGHNNVGRPSAAHDTGFGRSNNPSVGSSAYSQAGTGGGSEHFGPGHHGAKVMHKCHNCGVDNDISQHFKKDAVYRMG